MPDGLIIIVDEMTQMDWETSATHASAVVLLPAVKVDAKVAAVVAEGIEAFGTDGQCSVGESFTPQTLAEAALWLRERGAERIELRADPRHWDLARIGIGLSREAGILLHDLGGVPWDTEARERRPLTTSTLLMVAADAIFTPVCELGFFEELVLEEAGGWEQRAIEQCRAVNGWERRLVMLHSALRPAMTVILAEPGVRPMHRAATRMLNAVPDRGLRARHTLGEAWTSDAIINDAARVVETAKARGGRGPERIIIVVREDAEFVEDALSRAAWMLDEARVEIIAVDPQLGLLERHVTMFWSEKDAAAHAANLQAILAERENTEPF
ncbi:hypothetical protein RN51_01643 [Microbacterium oxydans]|uniref:Uncharacterized protein n=1 Tax=Microbacterium oxydans TaxID=82380 RepID=A0A0F0KPV2_9MICO|nr:hypothetical protein [Microbacterium oxydans]KJL22898.1 hypothetical protein RN51_01643 [Microbacterium oxydans]